MKAASITFIGGDDCGDVGSTTMGPPNAGLTFPVNKAVIVDPAKAKNGPERAILEHVITKTRTHPHFTVTDVEEKEQQPSKEELAAMDDMKRHEKEEFDRIAQKQQVGKK